MSEHFLQLICSFNRNIRACVYPDERFRCLSELIPENFPQLLLLTCLLGNVPFETFSLELYSPILYFQFRINTLLEWWRRTPLEIPAMTYNCLLTLRVKTGFKRINPINLLLSTTNHQLLQTGVLKSHTNCYIPNNKTSRHKLF